MCIDIKHIMHSHNIARSKLSPGPIFHRGYIVLATLLIISNGPVAAVCKGMFLVTATIFKGFFTL